MEKAVACCLLSVVCKRGYCRPQTTDNKHDLTDPEPVPLATDYASLVESDVPIVVQHTRLDSRQAENALLSTVAWGE
jgi:hypothetical protein